MSGVGYTPAYETAEPDEVEAFAQTEAGKMLVNYWGQHAAGYLGLLLARWDRLTSDLGDRDFGDLDDLIRNRLAPEERAYVFWALAG